MSQRQSRTPASRSERHRATASARRSRGRTWLRRGLWTVLALAILGVTAVGIAYARTDVPEPNEIATAQTSIVYYADGKTELGRLSDSEGNRVSVPLSQVPDHMQKAILAGEDQNFYENNGISPTGIARAVWVAVKGGQATQGGSTITQQYVKNYFLTSDRTLERKAREILLAVKIDRQQTKDEILENYLNTIYYGRGAYGIQTAAGAYFNKDVADLTVAESAFLASVIRGPSLYDPGLGEEQAANAEERSGYILDAMVENGWLTAEERSAATFPDTFVDYRPRTLSGTSGYLVEMVKNELVATHQLTESDIERGGLRVTSTIEQPKQVAMETAIKEERPSEQDVYLGMASITPGDGAIAALYGGADYAKRPQNAVTQDRMQAGSTFKIFTLIAALQSGDFSLRSTLDGSSPRYFEEFADPSADTAAGRRGRVKNFGDESFGQVDLRRATGRSVNTVYAELNIEVGAENSMKAAEDAGVRSPLEPNVGNVLGTDYVTVLDMATAYATIAAEGIQATPYIVKEIRFLDEGVEPITAEPVTQQVFDKDLMSDVIDAMTYPVEGGTARYVGQNLGRPAAGKTGTSESFRSAWFDGYVPQLAAAVGLYRSGPNGEELAMENLPDSGDITGGTYPARIWTAYMKSALEGTDVVEFPEPANINKDAKNRPAQTTRPAAPSTTAPAPSTTAPPTTTAPPETVEPEPTTPEPPPSEPGPTEEPSNGNGNGNPGGGKPEPSPPSED
ncbi:MAG TPA: transglycosylase domain-containing protein [Ornithinibacter sp.]|nr:transglycosylase domain-containing protein [Ornithinibacter sp.]